MILQLPKRPPHEIVDDPTKKLAKQTPTGQNQDMTNSRIDKLIAKKAQIEAQLQDAKARDRTQKRKDDTRRKIIVGALALEHAERNPDSAFTKIILRLIQNGVKTDKDRALFDLPPLPRTDEQSANDTAPQASTIWRRMVRPKK